MTRFGIADRTGTTRLRFSLWAAAAATALLTSLTGPAVPAVGAAPPTAGRDAVWSASLQGVRGVSPDTTVRNIARSSVDASSVRVRIGNPYGAVDATFRSASIGVQERVGEADLVPGSVRRLTFDGERHVTLAPGEQAYSDPVPLRVAAQQNLAISLYAPGAPINDHAFPPPTPNPPGSFLSLAGDHTSETGDASYPEQDVGQSSAPGYHPGQVWWVNVVDARSAARGTIVALGDSITAGHNAVGGGDRWTDLLAQRFNGLPAGQQLAVANAGISGNTVSRQTNPYDASGQCCGPPAPERLQQDVLSLAGAQYMILLEGTNDLGGGAAAPPAPAAQVIAGMREIADRAHAAGLRVVAGTIIPMCNAEGSTKEANRLAVNGFIRTTSTFDAVIDFDAAVKDPQNPRQIDDRYRADCYHPNAAGHAVMAEAIDLTVFDRVKYERRAA